MIPVINPNEVKALQQIVNERTKENLKPSDVSDSTTSDIELRNASNEIFKKYSDVSDETYAENISDYTTPTPPAQIYVDRTKLDTKLKTMVDADLSTYQYDQNNNRIFNVDKLTARMGMDDLPDSLSDAASLFNGSSLSSALPRQMNNVVAKDTAIQYNYWGSSSTLWNDDTVNTNELIANVISWETSNSGFAALDTGMLDKTFEDVAAKYMVSTVDTSMQLIYA